MPTSPHYNITAHTTKRLFAVTIRQHCHDRYSAIPVYRVSTISILSETPEQAIEKAAGLRCCTVLAVREES